MPLRHAGRHALIRISLAPRTVKRAPMDGTKKAEARWADQETLSLVRPEVRAILESSQAFHKLPSEDQKKLAGAMVEVSSYMTNPDGLAAKELKPGGNILARAQEDGVE